MGQRCAPAVSDRSALVQCARLPAAQQRPRPDARMCGGEVEPPFTSFDHLVGGDEQLVRHGQPERLRGLEIYDQLEFYRLLYRQVRRLSAFENPPGIDAREAKRIGKV